MADTDKKEETDLEKIKARLDRIDLVAVLLYLAAHSTELSHESVDRIEKSLKDGKRVWLQPYKDNEGFILLRVETEK